MVCLLKWPGFPVTPALLRAWIFGYTLRLRWSIIYQPGTFFVAVLNTTQKPNPYRHPVNISFGNIAFRQKAGIFLQTVIIRSHLTSFIVMGIPPTIKTTLAAFVAAYWLAHPCRSVNFYQLRFRHVSPFPTRCLLSAG